MTPVSYNVGNTVETFYTMQMKPSPRWVKTLISWVTILLPRPLLFLWQIRKSASQTSQHIHDRAFPSLPPLSSLGDAVKDFSSLPTCSFDNSSHQGMKGFAASSKSDAKGKYKYLWLWLSARFWVQPKYDLSCNGIVWKRTSKLPTGGKQTDWG